MNEQTLLSSRDAGRILGLTPSGVRRLADVGDLEAIRDSTGRRLFDRRTVDAVARARAAKLTGLSVRTSTNRDGTKGSRRGSRAAA